MRKLLNTRKKVIIAGAAAGAVVLGTGGAAYAYFTSTGSGTSSASVGSAANWTVSNPTGDTSNSLLPGSGSEKITFTVTNPAGSGHGNQAFNSVTAKVLDDSAAKDGSGNVLNASGTPVVGCLASWFNASAGNYTPALGTSIAPGSSATVDVTVTMKDVTSSQDKCQGISGPKIELDVNSG